MAAASAAAGAADVSLLPSVILLRLLNSIILYKPNMFPLQGGRPGFVSWWCDSLFHMHAVSQSEPECGGAGGPLG